MAVYDLEGSGRTEITQRTLEGLLRTVDFNKHRIFIVDNNSCDATKSVLAKFSGHFSSLGSFPPENLTIISNNENLGTAKAVNQGLKHRRREEHCIKMDNDVIIYHGDWIGEMEEALRRQTNIGILGLKRNDLIESPYHPDANWRSALYMLPQKPGERWIVFEKVKGVMGTCTMYNWRLLDKIGFLYQPTVYGYDDSLISVRSEVAGFVNGFLPYINIDHIDPGGTPYQKWKEDHSGPLMEQASKIADDYRKGRRSVYEEAGI